MAMTVVDNKAYLEARLPFGAKAGPSEYSKISEIIFGVTNDLLKDETWDGQSLVSPLNTKFDHPTRETKTLPFVQAMPLAVPIPSREMGCKGHIDDLVTVATDKNNNVKKHKMPDR